MKRSEALQLAADAAKMAEAHGLEVWQAVRFKSRAHYFQWLESHPEHLEYAIGVCEGKPVWPESVLYRSDNGWTVRWSEHGKNFQDETGCWQDEVGFHLTWAKPEPKCHACGQKIPAPAPPAPPAPPADPDDMAGNLPDD